MAVFGNGFVPVLNVGHGDPTVPVPECDPSKVAFIPAGGAARAVVGAGGVERYQCCIHPWMRTTVTVRPH